MQKEMSLGSWFDIDSLECEFDVETEDYPLESYSWGGSRGYGTDIVSCNLVSLQLGNKKLTKAEAIEIFGSEAIVWLEQDAMESSADN